MDPNANLAEQRRLVERLVSQCDNEGCSFEDSDVVRLMELTEAMDQWLSKGGFLPREWLQARGVVTAREAAAQKGVEYDPEDELVGRF